MVCTANGAAALSARGPFEVPGTPATRQVVPGVAYAPATLVFSLLVIGSCLKGTAFLLKGDNLRRP